MYCFVFDIGFTYLTFCYCCLFFFFFKQKTAYELRISDWSSDVCSSDLRLERTDGDGEDGAGARHPDDGPRRRCRRCLLLQGRDFDEPPRGNARDDRRSPPQFLILAAKQTSSHAGVGGNAGVPPFYPGSSEVPVRRTTSTGDRKSTRLNSSH